jgi:hypothetical protein
VWTINRQSHAELKGEDGVIRFHGPASEKFSEETGHHSSKESISQAFADKRLLLDE